MAYLQVYGAFDKPMLCTGFVEQHAPGSRRIFLPVLGILLADLLVINTEPLVDTGLEDAIHLQ